METTRARGRTCWLAVCEDMLHSSSWFLSSWLLRQSHRWVPWWLHGQTWRNGTYGMIAPLRSTGIFKHWRLFFSQHSMFLESNKFVTAARPTTRYTYIQDQEGCPLVFSVLGISAVIVTCLLIADCIWNLKEIFEFFTVFREESEKKAMKFHDWGRRKKPQRS